MAKSRLSDFVNEPGRVGSMEKNNCIFMTSLGGGWKTPYSGSSKRHPYVDWIPGSSNFHLLERKTIRNQKTCMVSNEVI